MTESKNNKRFSFGRNWSQFALGIDEEHITASVVNLSRLIDEDRLDGKSFLDIGCGSGLSSLAALSLGAKVHAFDYDYDSVTTAIALRDRFDFHQILNECLLR